MRMIALTAALGAVLAAAACTDRGGNEAAAEAGDTLDANGTAGGATAADGTAPPGEAVTIGADGDVDVDVNLKVPQPKLEGVTVGPDGVTVDAGDDPSVSVTTNRN